MEGEAGALGLLSEADDLSALISIEGLRAPRPDDVARPSSFSSPSQRPDPNYVPKVVMTAIACLAYFVLGAIVGATGPAVPALADAFGVRETRLGAAFTCRGTGYLTGSVLSSFAERAIGKPYLLGLSLLLAGAMILAAAFEPSFYVFLSLMAVQGLGLGGVDVTGNALLVELWQGRGAVDPWMQGMHAAFGLGAVASPIAVGQGGYRLAFSLVGLLGALPLLLIAFEDLILRALGHTGGGGGQGGGGLSRRLKEEGSEAKAGDEEEEEEEDEEEGEEGASLMPLIPLPVRLLMSGFLLVYVGIEVGFGGWISTVVLLEGLTSSQSLAAYAVSWFWGAITIGRLIAVPLAVALPSRSFLVVQLAVSLAGALLFLWLGGRSLGLAVGMSVVLGLGLSSIFPLMMTLPGDLGLRLDMEATSLFLVGSTLGEALLPLLVGLLLDLSVRALAWSAVACVLAMGGLYLAILIAARAKRPGGGGEEEGKRRSRPGAGRRRRSGSPAAAMGEMTSSSSCYLGGRDHEEEEEGSHEEQEEEEQDRALITALLAQQRTRRLPSLSGQMKKQPSAASEAGPQEEEAMA